MSYESALKLEKLTGILIPKTANFLPESWNSSNAGRLGAKARLKLYGNPGTYEGRKKGGLTTQELIKTNPEYFKRFGVTVKKIISYPSPSIKLAEFIGIFMGDGGVKSKYQIAISYNNIKDKNYSDYCAKLIKELFLLDSTRHINRGNNGADIIVSSVELVKFLNSQGFKIGDKIRNKIDIPNWIKKNKEFQRACLKGLMDTDGGTYFHTYKINEKQYRYLRICFTNCSKPLFKSVVLIFRNLGFTPKIKNGNRVYIYDLLEIKRYFKEIGSNNERLLLAYQSFYN
ncbi:MAG: LAGLIDADG family homing endonuclease [Candidatus Omnitrophota bacterium]